eukprot:scaffold129311_cov44-Prasinocladus_malaysianus.AAC.1
MRLVGGYLQWGENLCTQLRNVEISLNEWTQSQPVRADKSKDWMQRLHPGGMQCRFNWTSVKTYSARKH